MITYVDNPEEADYKGYLYALLMFLAAVLQSILLHQYFHRCYVVGMRIRTAVIAAVYQKVSQAFLALFCMCELPTLVDCDGTCASSLRL